MKHPAPFSPPVLNHLNGLVWPGWLVLDPFAGVGRIHSLEARTVGIEIEPEWASQAPGTIVGNALHLPFPDEIFDAIVTSPCYGNRMADHHNAKDGSHRRTYKHYLGRDLHPDNAGQLQWGTQYRGLHAMAWREAIRVLKVGGLFLLNISDHIRSGEIQQVSVWHYELLESLGLYGGMKYRVETKRFRFGENHKSRPAHEYIFVFMKPV